MYDERLRILVQDLGKVIFPTYDEIWFYESKRRMHYWLAANGVPHPRTWVFYDRSQALAFAQEATLPIVFKADFGSGSKGVRILRDRTAMRRLIHRCFRRGFLKTGSDLRDRQWGSVLFQEFLQDAAEWRMIRIGDSFFGYEKLRKARFTADLTLAIRPAQLRPPGLRQGDHRPALLQEHGYRRPGDAAAAVPRERTADVFGMGNPYEMCVVNGRPGRMVHDGEANDWRFEEGLFCQNKLCNLRVQTLVHQLLCGPQVRGRV